MITGNFFCAIVQDTKQIRCCLMLCSEDFSIITRTCLCKYAINLCSKSQKCNHKAGAECKKIFTNTVCQALCPTYLNSSVKPPKLSAMNLGIIPNICFGVHTHVGVYTYKGMSPCIAWYLRFTPWLCWADGMHLTRAHASQPGSGQWAGGTRVAEFCLLQQVHVHLISCTDRLWSWVYSFDCSGVLCLVVDCYSWLHWQSKEISVCTLPIHVFCL